MLYSILVKTYPFMYQLATTVGHEMQLKNNNIFSSLKRTEITLILLFDHSL